MPKMALWLQKVYCPCHGRAGRIVPLAARLTPSLVCGLPSSIKVRSCECIALLDGVTGGRLFCFIFRSCFTFFRSLFCLLFLSKLPRRSLRTQITIVNMQSPFLVARLVFFGVLFIYDSPNRLKLNQRLSSQPSWST